MIRIEYPFEVFANIFQDFITEDATEGIVHTQLVNNTISDNINA